MVKFGMSEKDRLRRQRSLAFFADKKSGKYKRSHKLSFPNGSVAKSIPPNMEKPMEINRSLDYDFSKYHVNVVITNYTAVLADRFYRTYPKAKCFLDDLKNYYKQNVYIILYVRSFDEVTKAKFSGCEFDLTLSLDKYDSVLAELNEFERPITILRKFIAQNSSRPHALTGPYVLLSNSVIANNNRQYDIIKDVRRYYLFKKDSEHIDFDALFGDIIESVEKFYKS